MDQVQIAIGISSIVVGFTRAFLNLGYQVKDVKVDLMSNKEKFSYSIRNFLYLIKNSIILSTYTYFVFNSFYKYPKITIPAFLFISHNFFFWQLLREIRM